MNFLAHYYFVQQQKSPYLTLGSVLPDLLRNHQKNWKIRLSLSADTGNSDVNDLIRGWHLHEAIDRTFHASAYFVEHSTALRKAVFPILSRKPFRPFFLAHIGYELVLDSLLLTDRRVETHTFYEQLKQCEPETLDLFFRQIGLRDYATFFSFYQRFFTDRYLEGYVDVKNLAYAMNQIGRRVWQTSFLPHEELALERVLQDYRTQLASSYFEVFDFIAMQK